jgi:phage gp29-like protein
MEPSGSSTDYRSNILTIAIPETEYKALADIINREYTDGLDRVLSAQENDDGSIVCVGQDGIKQLECEITDTRIKFRLLNPSQVDSNTAQFMAPRQDTPDRIAANLQKLGDPIVGGWLRQIEQILTTSDDLETAREALFQLYPDLESAELTQQMTAATAAASMAGFWEAEQDANV